MKITNVNDYVDNVHEKFPELSKQEVKRILVYGWKMILLYVNAGNDVSVNTSKLFFFIGRIPTTGLKIFETYCKKLSKRIAYMFKKTRSEWDGYYYFSRTENLYLDYLSLNKKKVKTFKHVFLYKLLEQLKVEDHSNQYIFRLKEDRSDRLVRYYEEIKTKNAELIMIRDPLKMGDILTSQNKFKYIQQ